MSSDPILPPGSERDPLPPIAPSSVDHPVAPLLPGSQQSTSTGLEPNVAAFLSVVLPLLAGVLFFVLEKRNQFVRFWAMQSIFFGAAWLVERIIVGVISGVLGPIPLIGRLWGLAAWIVAVAFAVVWLFMLFKAFTGKAWELPVLGKMAREQLARTPQP